MLSRTKVTSSFPLDLQGLTSSSQDQLLWTDVCLGKEIPTHAFPLALHTVPWVLRTGDSPGNVLDLHPSRKITKNWLQGAGQVLSGPGMS